MKEENINLSFTHPTGKLMSGENRLDSHVKIGTSLFILTDEPLLRLIKALQLTQTERNVAAENN